jgi:methionyl-tRNA formyltransferase
MNKVSLFLMNQKGFAVLEAIVYNNMAFSIAYVVGARDKSVLKDYYDEISSLCKEHTIPFKDRNEFNMVGDIGIVIGWRWLIRDFEQLIVFHDSLLPKYRGFAPLVNALINGEQTVGVTALFADKEYDKGNIIYQDSIKISYPKKICEAIDEISKLYVSLALKVLSKISENYLLKSYSQNEAEASYSLWRDDDDYLIDWTWNACKIKRFIDAVGFPYRGASTKLDGIIYKVWEVEEITDVIIENRSPGKVIFHDSDFPVVVCGEGLMKIKMMTLEEETNTCLPLNKFRVRFK